MSSDHAIVIGCSFAGLGAARVLRDRFATVTIVERDEIPAEWGARKGVPQSPHVHGIAKLGRELLEQMLPGFIAETQQQGAVLFDQVKLGASWGPYGWLARGESRALGYGVRRALLEHVARQVILALPGVTLRISRVDGLLSNGHRVSGVRLGDGPEPEIEADLVVDASGKGRSGPAWLEAAGFSPPEESTVKGYVGYASRWLQVPEDAWPGDFRFIGQLPTPSCTKGGILYPQDNGLYVMSLFGHARDYPPSSEDEYLEFLKHAATPLLHDMVVRSEPVSPISTSRSTVNRRRHYERLPEPPAGFVAVGDAAAAFNPIFGQGISSALKAASLLGETLDERANDSSLPGEFHRRLAAWLNVPWGQAIGYDLMFPSTAGVRTERTPEQTTFAHYTDILSQLSTVDPAVAEAILVATQSFDPLLLWAPDLVKKAKGWAAEERTPPPADPSRPPVLTQ